MKPAILRNWAIATIGGTVLLSGPASAHADRATIGARAGGSAFEVCVSSVFLFLVALLSFSRAFRRSELR